MRILFVSQYFPPEPGAPAARVSELAAHWASRGHDVTVLTSMPHHPTGVVPPEYRGRSLVEEDFRGVRVVRSWVYATANKGRLRRGLGYASFAFSSTLYGHLFARSPDVLIATSPQLLCGLAGRAISSLRRVPFVFEVRDLWPESIVAVGALPEGHPAIKALTKVEEHLYRAAKRIVVVTDAFRDKLVARGFPESTISVIKNGADLTRFVPTARETRLRAELGYNDKFVLAYVGTHGMAHGLDAVLNVAKNLKESPRFAFLFVGEGAERARLEQRARDEGLAHVRFLGALPRERMNEVYATADLCLVPLRKTELFTTVIPSKIFEIMAMQRPLLLSVDGEARQIVEASSGGEFVPPEDVKQMTEAIVRLSGEEAKLAEMGRCGREYVTKEYDRAVLADRYLSILSDVANRP